LIDTSAEVSSLKMKNALADIRGWAYIMALPALLVAAATPALLALNAVLPPNLIWLCYLVPVVLASVRWGFASAAAAVVVAAFAGVFFFTQPYYSLWMDDPQDVAALFLFVLAGFGSALLITNWRGGTTSHHASAIHKLMVELSQCATSHDVIVRFDRWISVVARGRVIFIRAEPSDAESGLVPEEIRRLAVGMCGSESDETRAIVTATNRGWLLKQLRWNNVIQGTLVVAVEIDTSDRELVEAAVATTAIRCCELAHNESLAAAAKYVSDARFSYQWRTSLTTISGAASVLLMYGKNRPCEERELLSDIRDEAMHVGQLLTDASCTSRAVIRETRSGC
jgi:K+-sensing histidine kinase KdpD